nr:LEF-5 [Darna trima granulovirus]
MSFNNGPIVSQNRPTTLHLFELFSKFRINNDYDGLVRYLTTNYPQNVKNRTFNFNNTGHIFHMMYAYVPSPSSKERKQIRLDCIEKLFDNTKNDFKLYEDLINLMINNSEYDKYQCPCEMITARLQDNIAYNESLKNKNFDTKPTKLKKEPIDAILFKYSINWKNSLKKKKVNGAANDDSVINRKKIETPKSLNNVIAVDRDLITSSSTLSTLAGFTIQQCQHRCVTEERQLRAGDEAVSFVTYCTLCKCVLSKQ